MTHATLQHFLTSGQSVSDKLRALLDGIGSLPNSFHHKGMGSDAELLSCGGGTLFEFF